MPNKKSFKSPSLVIDKYEEPAVKLTKQQKRDLKRKQAAEKEVLCKEPQSSASTTTVEPVKLTKQQKRDQKRNAARLQGGGGRATITKAPSHSQLPPSATDTGKRSSVYKRKTIYPPLYLPDDLTTKFTIPQDRFLTESDDSYTPVIDFAYKGFNYSPTETFPQSFHNKFEHAMIGLEREEKYQYDVTQPAGLGTKTAMTYVTRCVVGEPGTTYKYLGLRMFSIPWTPGSVGCCDHAVEIEKLNREMIKRSQVLLSENSEESGSCQYNLTLINR
jgi:hypothetical protein